jgi:hypothetical protein
LGSRKRDRPIDFPVIGERIDIVISGDPLGVPEELGYFGE